MVRKMPELDETDQRLLGLLATNSRASTSSLARALGVSRSTVQERIRRLESRRVIAGYTVRYGSAYEQRQIGAHVMIRVNPKESGRVTAALRELDAVRTLQTVSGPYDLVVTLQTPGTEAMDRVLDTIGDLPGVEKTTTSIVLSTRLQR
jgi:DNA-binding Lrp family transcriptional regulator